MFFNISCSVWACNCGNCRRKVVLYFDCTATSASSEIERADRSWRAQGGWAENVHTATRIARRTYNDTAGARHQKFTGSNSCLHFCKIRYFVATIDAIVLRKFRISLSLQKIDESCFSEIRFLIVESAIHCCCNNAFAINCFKFWSKAIDHIRQNRLVNVIVTCFMNRNCSYPFSFGSCNFI